MFKKTVLWGLKISGLILFIITILSLGTLNMYFDDSKIIYYLILVLSPLFIFPLVYKYYPGNRLKKVSLHFMAFAGSLLLLDISTTLLKQSRGIHQFSYQAGNVLGPLRVLIQNEPGQFVIIKSISILPYTTQYMIYALEDSMRAIEIKELISGNNSICPEISKHECFKKVYLAANSESPFNTTGQILLMAVGSALIIKEKGMDQSNKSSFETLFKLVEINNFISKSMNNEARVENQLRYFPKNELKALPKELTEKLDIVAPKYDEVSWRMVFGLSPKIKTTADKNIAEAYYLAKLDDELIKKFNKSLKKQLAGIKNEFELKLKQNSFKKKLTKSEIIEYQKQLNAMELI